MKSINQQGLLKNKLLKENHILESERENNPNSAKILYNLAMNYYNQGMSHFWVNYPNFSTKAVDLFEKAKDIMEKSLALNITFYALSELSLIKFRLKIFDEAKNDIEQAMELNDKYAQVYVNKGAMIFNAGNPNKARELFEKALELDSDLAIAWNNLGNCFMVHRQYKEAISFYEKATKLDPYLIQGWNALANACLNDNKIQEAINSYKRSLDLMESISVLKSLAQIYYNNNYLLEAKELYERIISLNPQDPHADINLSSIKSQLGEFQTIEEINEQLKEDPTNTQLLKKLASIYQSSNEELKAIETYTEILKLEDSEIPLMRRGILFIETKDFVKACNDLKLCIEQNSKNDMSYASYALALLNLNKYDEALENIEKAIQLNPLEASYYNTIGEILVTKGDYNTALDFFQKGLELDETVGVLWLNYARVQHQIENNSNKAKFSIKEALKHHPELKTIVNNDSILKSLL